GAGPGPGARPDGDPPPQAGRYARDGDLLTVAYMSVEDVCADDVDVEVVAERARRRQREAGHHREDGRERDSRDKREQELSAGCAEELGADEFGQVRRRQVAVRLAVRSHCGADLCLAHKGCGPESEERG